jgi:hypothetical protein
MMTMELTQIKRPVGSALPGHYEQNKGAFHDFILWPARQLEIAARAGGN